MPTRDEAWPEGTPCWIDVMVADPTAARQFYSSLFGWDVQDALPDTGGYLMCLLKGRPVAAIMPRPEGNPFPNVWSTYLAADDLDATAAKAKGAGAEFMMEPMDVMTAGRLAVAMDPVGAPFGMWQAGEHSGVRIYNEPGTLVWNELIARDYEGAKAFYASVFGYTFEEVGEGFTYSTIKLSGTGDIVGGLGAFDPDSPPEVASTWGVYFQVEDCDSSVAKAAQLGATVARPPFDTPFGRMATVTGPQGEAFSLIQPPATADSAGAEA
jgi:predicted enzyme related to lactoylglutathione lyase